MLEHVHACTNCTRVYALSLLARPVHVQCMLVCNVHACTGFPFLHKSFFTAALRRLQCDSEGAVRASKEDVLLLYANKWQQHIRQACLSLARFLQVPDAAPLHAAIQAAWPFTDQVNPLPMLFMQGSRNGVGCRCIRMPNLLTGSFLYI